MSGGILRYTLRERVVHWIAALTYAYVLATGLAFYTPALYWIAIVLGGGAVARFWHPWVALGFFATLVWMLGVWRGDMRITAADRKWGAEMEKYVRNEDEDLPPIDRFNLGQKYFFWAMLAAGAVLVISGAALWFADRVPAALRGPAVLLHVAAALVTIGAFIIHVYMGTAVVRGGFTSIIRGEVSPEWAKTHHRLWYYRVTGK